MAFNFEPATPASAQHSVAPSCPPFVDHVDGVPPNNNNNNVDAALVDNPIFNVTANHHQNIFTFAPPPRARLNNAQTQNHNARVVGHRNPRNPHRHVSRHHDAEDVVVGSSVYPEGGAVRGPYGEAIGGGRVGTMETDENCLLGDHHGHPCAYRHAPRAVGALCVDDGVVRLRRCGGVDVEFLCHILVMATHSPLAEPTTVHEMMHDGRRARFVAGWGTRQSDVGVVAEDHKGCPIGAAWCRLFREDASSLLSPHADPLAPEVIIGVLPEWRGRGVGARLLAALVDNIREQKKNQKNGKSNPYEDDVVGGSNGCDRDADIVCGIVGRHHAAATHPQDVVDCIELAVGVHNAPAVRLYARLGFRQKCVYDGGRSLRLRLPL